MASNEITRLLESVRQGDENAVDELYRLVYEQLRKIAKAQRARWSGNYTMCTSSLISEVYLKLSGSSNQNWQDRAHFFRVASRAMRQILLNYGQESSAAKRGGAAEKVELDESRMAALASACDIVALEQAMERLETLNERSVRVFECRRLGGLSIAETAEALDISLSTVKRESQFCEAWLKREITGETESRV